MDTPGASNVFRVPATPVPLPSQGGALQLQTIATESDLERFAGLPLEQRELTEQLRGVMAETALSGIVRYNWTLLRPLVELAMDQVRGALGMGQG